MLKEGSDVHVEALSSISLLGTIITPFLFAHLVQKLINNLYANLLVSIPSVPIASSTIVLAPYKGIVILILTSHSSISLIATKSNFSYASARFKTLIYISYA